MAYGDALSVPLNRRVFLLTDDFTSFRTLVVRDRHLRVPHRNRRRSPASQSFHVKSTRLDVNRCIEPGKNFRFVRLVRFEVVKIARFGLVRQRNDSETAFDESDLGSSRTHSNYYDQSRCSFTVDATYEIRRHIASIINERKAKTKWIEQT